MTFVQLTPLQSSVAAVNSFLDLCLNYVTSLYVCDLLIYYFCQLMASQQIIFNHKTATVMMME